MVIWKYALPIEVLTRMNTCPEIPMPAGARILTIQLQGSVPTLWALVDPATAPTGRRFVFHGTGTPIDAIRGAYVGTIQLYAGALVLHCFEAP